MLYQVVISPVDKLTMIHRDVIKTALIDMVGFCKYIHCHLARHTFATTCLSLGIPLEVTSKLLGHKSVETTLIYAKYVDAVLDSEMKKFQKL